MVALFKKRNVIQIFLLVLIAVASKLAYILHPTAVVYNSHMGILPEIIKKWSLNYLNPFVIVLLMLLINIGSAIYANTVLVSYRMFPKTNSLVALCVILLASLIPLANTLSASLILLPLLIWSYKNITSIYHSPTPKSKLYNAGFVLSVGALLYHPFVLFAIILLIGLSIMRPFRLRELLILLLGLTTPYYLALSYQYIFDHWHPRDLVPFIHFTLNFKADPYILVAYGIIVLWFAIGFYYWQSNLNRMLIQIRKNWLILMSMSFLMVIMFFINTGNVSDTFVLAIFPVSTFAASAFVYPKKNFFPNLFFWIIAFIIIITNLHYYEIVNNIK